MSSPIFFASDVPWTDARAWLPARPWEFFSREVFPVERSRHAPIILGKNVEISTPVGVYRGEVFMTEWSPWTPEKTSLHLKNVTKVESQ